MSGFCPSFIYTESEFTIAENASLLKLLEHRQRIRQKMRKSGKEYEKYNQIQLRLKNEFNIVYFLIKDKYIDNSESNNC